MLARCFLLAVVMGTASAQQMNGVDAAMAGWEELRKDPSKMQEVFMKIKQMLEQENSSKDLQKKKNPTRVYTNQKEFLTVFFNMCAKSL